MTNQRSGDCSSLSLSLQPSSNLRGLAAQRAIFIHCCLYYFHLTLSCQVVHGIPRVLFPGMVTSTISFFKQVPGSLQYGYYGLHEVSFHVLREWDMGGHGIMGIKNLFPQTFYPVRSHTTIRAVQTVNIVFFSMMKMPRTLNPIEFPCRRSRNRYSCKTILVFRKKSQT